MKIFISLYPKVIGTFK